MSNTYNIGTSNGQVSLSVDITTVGLAASRASVLIVSDNSPGVPVAHSVDATGDIANQAIGKGTFLKGKRLTVFTLVNLTGTDPESRATEAAAIRGSYTLSGGNDGTKTFNSPLKSYQDPSCYVIFIIDLV
ncbi:MULTISPECIES: hypothetical protein [Pedobacter]|uniref:DUF4402 domain-containing protein n=1 Tax=Pedobacter sp. KACC 23697 TaxID=3149230 RepID=A0AAU7K9H8_9SPHI